ncbi:PLD nuclease N-terminal domain-containing protein [Enterococcus hulanensis]|uniref:PLD nuclease N-terminal domain-containing protein n=1 Tax=Enterococcus hulanensis TaxID=2559929 RepID=UPI00289103E9|nr:PLD nuclease N-terminal domain-containing protein [Enterococcus hulanensis]MDT2658532.1 PLD nuclease N-terminal domain-containing protein [Enterococcus hulanensis]
MNNFAFLKDNLPIFLPLIILELILVIAAVTHILKHPHYRFGNKIIWLFVVVLIQIIGPVIYFVFGRGDDQ